MIEVVSGVLIQKDRVLLAQRLPEKDFEFAWEFPGGKVEQEDKHHYHTLRRELREELGIEVIGIGSKPLSIVEITVKPHRYRIHFYVTTFYESEIHSCEGQGFGWFTSDEVVQMKPLLTPPSREASHYVRLHMQSLVV